MPLLPCLTAPYTQQDLLDLLDRILPEHYILPLKTGTGYEVLQAYAAMLARISQAVSDLGCDLQVSTADDGSFSVGEVEFYRNSLPSEGQLIPGQIGNTASIVAGAPAGEMRVTGLSGVSAMSVGHFIHLSNTAYPANSGGFRVTAYNGPTSVDALNVMAVIPDTNNGTIGWHEEIRDVIIKAGSLVTTSNGGRDFLTLADIMFLSTELGPKTAQIEAIAKGYEWNVPGRVTAADGTVLPGDIDIIKTLVEEPALLDLSFHVQQLLPTAGGSDATIGALGMDKGIGRLTGEELADYRTRVRALPDTVSLNAIARTVLDLLEPAHVDFSLIETWNIAYQTCYDAPTFGIGGSPFNPNLCAYDRTDNDTFRCRWLDENDHRGGTIIVIDPVQPLLDYGMVWDDPAMEPHDLLSPISGGRRAVTAFDVPQDFAFAAQGAYDALDYKKNAIFKGIYDTMQGIKPAGTSVAVELLGE